MTTAALLAEARRRGIRLSAQGSKLRYKGPAGALTPELKAALVEHKAEVLAVLTAPDPGRPTPATWGLTRGIRVVELAAYTPSERSRDPIRYVCCEGWRRWEAVRGEGPAGAPGRGAGDGS